MSVLFADSNITVPSGTALENAKIVAVNGWNVAEKPLKDFFEKDGKTFIQIFLKTASKPYETIFQKDTPKPIDQIPKIYMTRADNYYALAYAKFLENKNKSKEALLIYETILQGLYDSNLHGSHTLGLIYRIVIERMTVASLEESLHNNVFDDNQKQKLYGFLQDRLLLNTKLFDEALDDDLYYFKKVCERELAIINSSDFIYYDQVQTILGPSDVNRSTLNLMCSDIIEKKQKFNSEFAKLSNSQNILDYEQTHETMLKKTSDQLSELKNYSREENKQLEISQKNFIQLMSDSFYYLTSPKVGRMKLDMLQNIETNKRLLAELQGVRTPNKSE